MKNILFVITLLISGVSFGQTAEEYFYSGRDKAEANDHNGAVADFTKVIELNPDKNNLASAYNNRGISKRYLKDYNGAISDCTKAIEIDPNYTNAYVDRGISKDSLGDLNGAYLDYTVDFYNELPIKKFIDINDDNGNKYKIPQPYVIAFDVDFSMTPTDNINEFLCYEEEGFPINCDGSEGEVIQSYVSNYFFLYKNDLSSLKFMSPAIAFAGRKYEWMSDVSEKDIILNVAQFTVKYSENVWIIKGNSMYDSEFGRTILPTLQDGSKLSITDFLLVDTDSKIPDQRINQVFDLSIWAVKEN